MASLILLLVEFRARIVPCIPMLVNLLDSPCHDAAARALSELAEHGDFSVVGQYDVADPEL